MMPSRRTPLRSAGYCSPGRDHHTHCLPFARRKRLDLFVTTRRWPLVASPYAARSGKNQHTRKSGADSAAIECRPIPYRLSSMASAVFRSRSAFSFARASASLSSSSTTLNRS